MPRLSLYRPKKGNDYKFIDKTVWEMFQVGGTDVLVHKYLGPGSIDSWDAETNYKVGNLVQINRSVYKATAASTGVTPPDADYWEYIRSETPTTPIYNNDNPLNIQDLLFLENRDRKYDSDVYVLRGVYNIQDTDFNLSQFGLFLQNDTIFITFHINDTVEKLGRKFIAGDVFELPHLKDEYALNDLQFALKRFYVIEEVTRAAEGYSVTWYPHLYRAKCKPLVDSQEFKDILDKVANDDNFKGEWNQDVTYYPGDVVLGLDGKNYTVIEPDGVTFDFGSTYRPGDVIINTNGLKYIVVDPATAAWNGTTVYQPGDSLTGPDGKIYTVKDNAQTVDGISGILPPNLDLYEQVLGLGVTGVDPANSNRYVPIDVTTNGITNIFPPNSTYYELADSLRDIMSTYEREMQITKAVLDQAEADAPRSGYDTSRFYTVQKDEKGNAQLTTVDASALDASIQTQATDENGTLLFNQDGSPVYLEPTSATNFTSPDRSDYDGYLLGDGIPTNGVPFSAGIAFPIQPVEGQYCLRTDFLPKRLFRFNGTRWVKMEDNVRMTMSNLGASDTGPGDMFEGRESRQTQKATFVNNDKVSRINGKDIKEKQSLSKALRPEADE